MRLVIEREGGFDVIEDSDTITRIDVQSFGVKVTFVDDTGGEWSEVYPVADHAAACRLSAAIAVRCGTLVEPLASSPESLSEGASSQWVAGEPPRDGRWYVVALHRGGSGYGMPPSLAAWYGGRWVRCDAEPETAVAWHLPTPVPGVPTR
jgi:hypothetical protein